MSNGFQNCPNCGRLISADATVCQHCGATITAPVYENIDGNNSGQGPNSQVSDVVAKRFNWGAFFFNWIWCLIYKQYIMAIVILVAGFIPFLGLLVVIGLQIYLGIKGNTWAWQAKHYKSVEEFHAIHKKWAIWGVVLPLIGILVAGIIVTTIAVSSLQNNSNVKDNKIPAPFSIFINNAKPQRHRIAMKKSVSILSHNVAINEAEDKPLHDFSSEGLTNYFLENLPGEKIAKNKFKTFDGMTYTFVGDGRCADNDDCYVKIDTNGDMGPNEEWIDEDDPKDIITVYLINENNYVKLYLPDAIDD